MQEYSRESGLLQVARCRAQNAVEEVQAHVVDDDGVDDKEL